MNENSEKVSIILPTYNRAKYIRQSIDSCLNQTYKNIELIIIDNGSQDATSSIIQEYTDSRIKYIRYETNSGLANALNKGFSLAKGQYLTWTSDDNFYCLNAIEHMVSFLQAKKNIDFVYADFYKIYEKNNIVVRKKIKEKSVRWLNILCCIGACFLYRDKVYREIGDYNPSLVYYEDYDYWLRVREKFKIGKINKCLYYYRVHTDSMSGQKDAQAVEKLVENLQDKYMSTSERVYYYTKKYFEKGNYNEVKKLLFNCFCLNFLTADVWRMLAIVYFPAPLVSFIRKIKWKMLGI